MASIFDRKNIPAPTAESFAPISYNAPRPLTSSAARVDLKNKREVEAINKRRQQDKWQEEAWEYFDLIGEIKASATLIASVMSRVNLYGAYVDDSSSVPSSVRRVEGLDEAFVKTVEDTLWWLESGNGGTSGLLRTAALNMFVTGECYLVREPARFSSGEGEKWQIRSIDEIASTTGRNSQVVIKPRRDSKPVDYIPLPQNGYVCRMWRPHPRFADEADSSLKGVLDTCDELLLINRLSAATAKSRLNAGLLFVPDGLSNVTQSDGNLDGEEGAMADDVSDSFEEDLIDTMTTPISDVSSASAIVPIVLRGPEDLGEKIIHIKFERALDPQLVQRADKALERILAGLDIPMDVAKGLSGVKYSNAILIEEQLYKAHIEPMILLIVDQLTVGFLRPALRAQGVSEDLVQRATIWYDPSAITAKPSKAEAATILFDKNAISLQALRRANGFSESDAPSELERVQRLAYERAVLSDALSESLLDTMVPEEVKEAARQQQLATSDPASANALSQALGGDPNAAPAPAGTDTMNPAQNVQSPPTLMEP
ncbi:portal protein [Arthrobacter phage Atuin]|nr:portal protein [Arthrobacter phage Atuin]